MTTNKTIFITGAASGIGKATALHFYRQGWFLGLFDTNAQALKDLHSQLDGSRICVQTMDVSLPESVKAATGTFLKTTQNRIDVLFNCAGILKMGRCDQISLDEQTRTVQVNLTGILNCIHFCLPALKATAHSRIINMSSASSIYGTPELAIYSATKAAVSTLTEALNIEYAPYGITVCDITAPYVRTPMITQASHQATSVSRLGIHLSPEKVAETVWKAAHGNRVHWYVGILIYFLLFSNWAFPFARRSFVKWMTFSSKS